MSLLFLNKTNYISSSSTVQTMESNNIDVMPVENKEESKEIISNEINNEG